MECLFHEGFPKRVNLPVPFPVVTTRAKQTYEIALFKCSKAWLMFFPMNRKNLSHI